MKYSPLPPALFQKNREKFIAQMKPRTIAIFHSNDLVADNADSHYRFSQNSNTYYLSGLDQEEILLVLFPDAPTEKWKEMLFYPRKPMTTSVSGRAGSIPRKKPVPLQELKVCIFYGTFDDAIRRMASHFDGVYLDVNEHERNGLSTISAGHRLARKFREEFPAHHIYRSAPICESLRAVKEKEELVPMQEAMDITEKAFRRVLAFVKPGVHEYEIEAEIAHEFFAKPSYWECL